MSYRFFLAARTQLRDTESESQMTIRDLSPAPQPCPPAGSSCSLGHSPSAPTLTQVGSPPFSHLHSYRQELSAPTPPS